MLPLVHLSDRCSSQHSLYTSSYLPCLSSLCLQCELLGYCYLWQVGKDKGNNDAIDISLISCFFLSPKWMQEVSRNLSAKYCSFTSCLYSIVTQAKEHLPSGYPSIDFGLVSVSKHLTVKNERKSNFICEIGRFKPYQQRKCSNFSRHVQ